MYFKKRLIVHELLKILPNFSPLSSFYNIWAFFKLL